MPETADDPIYEYGGQIMAADFDDHRVAEFAAKYHAQSGPNPHWWEVIELRRKDARSVCREDKWHEVRRWGKGQMEMAV